MAAPTQKDNEVYFDQVKALLSEGGSFIWKDLAETLIKKDGRLRASQKVLDHIKERGLVSQAYYNKTFILK
jgi:hypothetical protein